MARFCSKHCGERTVPELKARQAELEKRGKDTLLSPTLEKELARVKDTLKFKELRGEQ